MENLRLAGFGNRLVAQIIDHIIIVAVFSAIMGILIAMGVISGLSVTEAGDMDNDAVEGLIAVLFSLGIVFMVFMFVVAPIVYEVVMLSSSKRATLGKMIMKIEVVSQTGTTLTVGDAFLRTLIKYITGNFCFLLWLWPLFNPQEQALHDLTVKDFVVYKS